MDLAQIFWGTLPTLRKVDNVCTVYILTQGHIHLFSKNHLENYTKENYQILMDIA